MFIDGDAIAPKEAKIVLDHLQTLGRVCISRAYGNHSGRTMANWTALIREHSVVARHLPSVALGKNASDIAMTVDAVELLLTRDIDAFAVIASDADFTPLAIRLREGGKEVYGFGRKATPVSFRNACTVFREVHSLVSPQIEVPAAAIAERWSLSPADAEHLVVAALGALSADNKPVPLTVLGQCLAANHAGFDVRIYSRRTLKELLRDLPSITVLDEGGVRYAKLEKPPVRNGSTSVEGRTEGRAHADGAKS